MEKRNCGRRRKPYFAKLSCTVICDEKGLLLNLRGDFSIEANGFVGILEPMGDLSFTQKSFDLLKELNLNNNREWYLEHKAQFKHYLLDPFEGLLAAASERLAGNAIAFKGSKKTMFRMNRDVRFSMDKRPYKENVGGLLTATGKKDDGAGLVYCHIDKDGGFIAAGFHMLPTLRLNRIRDRMLSESDAFQAILDGLEDKGFPFSMPDSLKGMPRGYSEEKDHSLAQILKYKHLIVERKATKRAWTDGSILETVVEVAEAATPLVAFGNAALSR